MARAGHAATLAAGERVMTDLGLQSWSLMLFRHDDVATMLEVIHALGSSYRSASSGVVASIVCGRIAMIFCRTAGMSLLENLVPRDASVQVMQRAFGR